MKQIDPLLHGALVIVMTAVVNILFGLLHINLGGEIVNQLATLLVGYILSLFGYSLWLRATLKARGLLADNLPGYKPPFT